MVDVNVDFIFENEQPINADFQLEPDVTYTADIKLSEATRDHTKLYNRDRADQHPMGAITGLEDALEGLSDDITAENNRAIEAEETLDNKIDSEVDTRADEITRVEGLISDEETRAEGVEGGLREDLTAEINRATNAEGVLQTNITSEENRAKGVEQQLTSSIDSNHQAISNHVSDKNNPHEVTKAQVGLGNVENLAPADMPMSTATKTYVDNADNGLQGQITTINTTIGGYGNIVTHNVSEFATSAQGALADTALQPNDNISELTNNLNYQTATQVANSIAVETGNRESADNNLQSQIDAIVSASDVFDIVGTYAELQAYDISTVPVNDIIKVLVDSTHAGAATYYRCVETNNVKSWSYIGSEGAYYTKAEADSNFVPQTRTVNNKALSSNITLTATDVGALPSSTVIPTVNDATVTIQKNGSTVSTFTLNQSSNETVNITVPTKTSEITNDSGFITASSLPTVNDGQLDIQVNGSSIATFTANQSGNTTANIVVGNGLPSQTGNEGKFLSTDGTDASWQYPITDKGMYSAITQYYPGDMVQYFYQGAYHWYICKQAALNQYPSDNIGNSYWVDMRGYTSLSQFSGDYPLLPLNPNGWSGNTLTGVNIIAPQSQSAVANMPTVNTWSGLLKVPGGINGYSPDSAFGATAFSNDYSDLDNLPNYGAGLSYSSSSLQLLDQNGNNLGSAVTIKSTPDLDGVTIDTNSSDELEAIGVIDNNGNAIKTWTGTLAQYNAIATKDPNTLYNITDDMSVPQTILETLYPVGSLYIGKMSTCPLASLIPNSTWTLVASDKVLQGSGTYTAGTSVNAGLPNITGTLERVVTCTSGGSGTAVSKGTGAFSGTPSTAVNKTAPGSGNWWNDTRDLSFKASNSNSIYGKSTTVQPPAYVVNIWERTA